MSRMRNAARVTCAGDVRSCGRVRGSGRSPGSSVGCAVHRKLRGVQMFARSRAVSRLSPLLTVSPCLSNKLSSGGPCACPLCRPRSNKQDFCPMPVVALCRGGADGSGLTSLRCPPNRSTSTVIVERKRETFASYSPLVRCMLYGRGESRDPADADQSE